MIRTVQLMMAVSNIIGCVFCGWNILQAILKDIGLPNKHSSVYAQINSMITTAHIGSIFPNKKDTYGLASITGIYCFNVANQQFDSNIRTVIRFTCNAPHVSFTFDLFFTLYHTFSFYVSKKWLELFPLFKLGKSSLLLKLFCLSSI